jgi:O-antigen/teichoic acid export membrane protein
MSNVKKGLFASILLIGESFSKKLIGLFSTLILARTLVPEDFGLVAIATLLVGFLDVFTQTGANQYLTRADTVTEKMLNTSWTINIILKGIIAISLVAVAPLAVDYYSEPRLFPVLSVFAVMMLISSLNNPALVHLHREQAYGKIVKFNILGKVCGVITAVSIALLFKSYWALIFGHFTVTLWTTVASYFIYPYKPALSLHNAKIQWRFSGWLIPQSMLGYIRTQFDTFLVSSTFGKAELGSYHTMKYLAFIPSSQILLPATQPLLASLSQIKHSKEHFAKQYNVAFIVTMLLAIPFAATIFTFSDIIIHVFMGENWVQYANLFGLFALLIPAYGIFHHANRVAIIYAETKLMAMYEIVFTVSLVVTLLTILTSTVFEFALLRVGLEYLMSIGLLIFMTLRYNGVKPTLRLFTLTVPICLTALVSAWVGNQIELSLLPLITLTIKCGVFAIVFLGLMAASLYAVKPWSSEYRYIFELLGKAISKIIGKFSSR